MGNGVSAIELAKTIAFHSKALTDALQSADVIRAHDPMGENWKGLRWLWLQKIRRDDRISSTGRLVAHAIALQYADGLNSECRPGVETLAKDMNFSPRTIERCLTELKAQGWILRLGGNAPGVPAAFQCVFPRDVSKTI